MDNKLLHLKHIIDIDKFQRIQDDLAKSTDIAIIAIDYKGRPITKHSNCSAFCYSVRQNQKLNTYCEKCDSRGGLEAARLQDAYIYLCHAGIIDLPVPIIVDDQYLGALMAGQIRLNTEKNEGDLERIVSQKYQINLNEHPDLKEFYEKLPCMSWNKIESIAQMMFYLVNYLVDEALIKISLIEENQKLIASNLEVSSCNKTISVQAIPQPDNYAINNSQLTPSTLEHCSNPLLNPAFEYIHTHYNRKISLDHMAKLCNISPSYLSRMFKRLTGLTFSTFVNYSKIEQAILLLENTSLPILNISLELGYEDCGYFIKMFKKFTKLTPAEYRRKNQSSNSAKVTTQS
ncbi:MAG: PocR ligand-binding domain-containing protein [Lachnospiraceae bacterium]|nr:PocR ligand-binding domain-containing protein [Lachnospiraceae bacterium]